MQTRKHFVALGLLAAFGALAAASMKQPAERVSLTAPPVVEHRQVGVVASFVVSASDACVKTNAPDPMAMNTASLQALRDACTRAAEEQARALNWDVEGEPQEPVLDAPVPIRRVPIGSPRVARRAPPGATDEPSGGRSRN